MNPEKTPKRPALRRFDRDVLWSVASLAVLGMSGIVINSLILALSGTEALGVFNQAFAFFIVATQFAVGGLQASTLKHCSHAQDDPAQCAVIASSALMLTAGLALAVCLALYGALPWIGQLLDSPAVARGVGLVVPGIFLFAVNKVLLMVLNGMRNMRAFAVFQALRYLLITLGVIGILLLRYPASHLALSLTIAELLLFLALTAYVRIRLFALNFSLTPELKNFCSRHVSFGLRGFLSGTLMELNTRVDVLMLGIFMSDAVVGVYSFASTFAEGFAMLNSVLRQNVDPVLGKFFAAGRLDRIGETSRRIRTKFLPFMLCLGLVLSALFPLLIRLLASGKNAGASWGVFAILAAGAALASAHRPFMGVIIQGGRPGVYTMMLTASVLGNMALNGLLIPLLGIYGAAAATSLIYLGEAVGARFLAKRLFGVRL